MTKVYIIRHAEAEGNLYRRIHGWYDSALTELGMQQAEALAKRFESIRLDAVYSSDLTRTVKTAQAAARGSGVPVIPTPRLREVCLGVWEDKTWGEASYSEPEQLILFNKDPAKWHIEGGEPLSVTQERMLGAVREFAAAHDGKAIAVVSHGAAIRAMLAAAVGLPSDEITKIKHCDNTAVTELDVDNETGRITVVSMGDSSHLESVGSRFQRQNWWKKNMDYDASSMRFVSLSADDEQLYRSFGGADFVRALSRTAANENAAVWSLYNGEKIGLIELDISRSDDNAGWIDWYCVRPENRGMLLSVQLLGHAVSVYRALGRDKLRLVCEEAAAAYFEHFGFYREGGVMTKDIRV